MENNNLYLIVLFNSKTGHILPKGYIPNKEWSVKIINDLNNYFNYDNLTEFVFKVFPIPSFYTINEKIETNYCPNASEVYLNIVKSENYKSRECNI